MLQILNFRMRRAFWENFGENCRRERQKIVPSRSRKTRMKPSKTGKPLPKSQLDFEFFLLHGTWWKIEGISPLCQKIRTIEFTLKIPSRSQITRLCADLNPLSKTQKNQPFGENWERFYARWRERAREIPGAKIHPHNMLLLTLTKSKQQRMDEHENAVRVL